MGAGHAGGRDKRVGDAGLAVGLELIRVSGSAAGERLAPLLRVTCLTGLHDPHRPWSVFVDTRDAELRVPLRDPAGAAGGRDDRQRAELAVAVALRGGRSVLDTVEDWNGDERNSSDHDNRSELHRYFLTGSASQGIFTII